MSAIVFLTILLFNFYGYRLFISVLQNNSDIVLEKRVDKNDYSDSELISIKTTLNLPYYNSSPDYERVYGSINIDGVDYEYVKRRVYQDTLELLCIPNHDKTKLNTANNEIAKSSAEGQSSSPLKNSNPVIKIALPDFFQETSTATTFTVASLKQFYFAVNNYLLPAGYASRQDRPPQSVRFIA